MKLILTGGGESEHFAQLDSHFLSLLSVEPSLLFVPLANDPEDFNPELERIIEVFSTIEFDILDMVQDFNDLDWDYLKNFDAIYIDGGNTFQLMDHVRNSHFYELLKRFTFHGGVVNGDSAGAIILGSHLQTAHFGEEGDENEAEITCYQGLNLIGDWAVHCHYNLGEDEEIEEFVSEYGFPVIALADEAGVSIEGRLLKVFGEADVSLFGFLEKTVLRPGQTFDLSPGFVI